MSEDNSPLTGLVTEENGARRRAEAIARRLVGSASGEHLVRGIVESLMAFPKVTPQVKMLAAPPHTCHSMNPPFPGPCRACELKE